MNESIQIAVTGDILAGNYLSEFLSEKNGNVSRFQDPSRYIWGDLLPLLNDTPYKLANLETAVCDRTLPPWPGKGWCFRLDPLAAWRALKEGGFDYVGLGNNHTLDYGVKAIEQLTGMLDSLGVKYSGAGQNEEEAFSPAVLDTEVGKIGIYSFAFGDCHLSDQLDENGKDLMAATSSRPGVCQIDEPTEEVIDQLCIRLWKDKFLYGFSFTFIYMHWGNNYPEPRENPPIPWYPQPKYRRLAHRLIDHAGVKAIIGCSTHHTGGVEEYKGGLILYGTGDFLSDYYKDPAFYNVPSFFQCTKQHPAGEHPCAFMSFLYTIELTKHGIAGLTMIPTEGKNLQVLRVMPEHPHFDPHLRCAEISSNALGTTLQRNGYGLIWKAASLKPLSGKIA